MRPQTVIELAGASGILLPTADPTELYSYDSLDSFLEIFWLVQSTLTTGADWARLAYEAVVDSAAHEVVHLECFFTPARHLATGTPLREILAGLDEGITAAEAETGTTCLLIGDMDRAFGPAAGLAFVEDLVRLRRQGAAGADRVIGVGMDSTELGIDSTTFLPGYQAARAGGLKLTGHQGENSTAAEVGACLTVLGLDRIDHAFPVLEDPELTARLAEERFPITICPTSNVVIARCFDRLEDHVYPQMRQAGLLATVNTDDPALSDLNLAQEYDAVAQAFGYGWDEMVAIALDGAEACWLDDPDKTELRNRIARAASELAPSREAGSEDPPR